MRSTRSTRHYFSQTLIGSARIRGDRSAAAADTGKNNQSPAHFQARYKKYRMQMQRGYAHVCTHVRTHARTPTDRRPSFRGIMISYLANVEHKLEKQ